MHYLLLTTRLIHVHIEGDAGLLVLNRIKVTIIRISLADLICDAEVRVMVDAMIHFDRGGPGTLCIIHNLNLTLTNLDRCCILISLTRGTS